VRKILLLLALTGLLGCRHDSTPIVSQTFVDSLLQGYTPPVIALQNEAEMQFWKNRINPALPGFLDESRYAGDLALEFRFFGVMDSLTKSDSILLKVSRDFNHKEASTDLAMMAHCITEHRFSVADSFLGAAKALGLRPYESLTASFDVDFELGKYTAAARELNGFRSLQDYGYYFRKSKMDHFNGLLDSAIADMLRAADLAGGNKYLKGVALANAGDLYIHAGELDRANDVYVECVRLNSADFHSLMGLGWIALVHDHNDTLAEKVFRFVGSVNQLPDALYKLSEVTDSATRVNAALAFEQRATNTAYGRMYNKYLIELYTGVLQNPARAEALAKDELNNRGTPQTFAWYAWSLFANGKKQEAYQVFEKNVSGKPLEGLELYWMGKLMKGLDKGYNAQEFFKAAYTTRYDLSPAARADLQKELEE
jgi:hypothetical protein